MLKKDYKMSTFKLIFLQNYRRDHLRKGRNRIVGLFGVALGLKKMSIAFPHCNFNGPDMPELLVKWAQIDFGTRVYPSQMRETIFFQSPNL